MANHEKILRRIFYGLFAGIWLLLGFSFLKESVSLEKFKTAAPFFLAGIFFAYLTIRGKLR
jgi:hypothetical protein